MSPPTFPISVKGVVVRDGKVLLLKNDRDEWELPGGRIELGETPEECVAREITEETQWTVTTGPLLDAWMYYIDVAKLHVFIVTYGCYPNSDTEPVLSYEHKEIGLFTEHEVPTLNMPDGYKRSIATWYTHLRADTPATTDQIASQVFPARLVVLFEHVSRLLSEHQRQWYREYIEAGEWALALELLADWLAEDETPIPPAVRAEMIDLGHDMEINERISAALAHCPDRGPEG